MLLYLLKFQSGLSEGGSSVSEDSAFSGVGTKTRWWRVLLACEPLTGSNAANWILTEHWVPSEPDTALHINIPPAIKNTATLYCNVAHTKAFP